MKFSFIDAEKAYFPVSQLCRVLEVSRSGYYAHAKRGPSKREQRDEQLFADVRKVHTESRETYGSPRVLAALRNDGHIVGKRRVERALRALGLSGSRPHNGRRTTRSNPRHVPAENLLARDFTASAPNRRWVTDITYVWTNEGWSYVSAILDLFSRRVVGWAIDSTLKTSLPLRALDMALGLRRPAAGLIHHSDRGCQYTSDEYRKVLDERGIVVSMSRKGNCWDNAVAESFFSTLKNDLVYRGVWPTRLGLRNALFGYLEVFYNRRRLHSSLGYRTPDQAELDFTKAAAA